MRFAWKLLLLATIGVGAQLLIDRYEWEIDEAQFAVRCLLDKWYGDEASRAKLVDDAQELYQRHWARMGQQWGAARCATTRPAEQRGSSVADELERSLCDRDDAL